jgi:hypothetical protein
VFIGVQIHLHTSVCDLIQQKIFSKLLFRPISDDMSPEAMAIFRSSYINLDEALSIFAMNLFLTRIGIVERETNMLLLCANMDGEAIMTAIDNCWTHPILHPLGVGEPQQVHLN